MLRKFLTESLIKLKTVFRFPFAAEQSVNNNHHQIPYTKPVLESQFSYHPADSGAALTRWEQGDRLALTDIKVEDVHAHPDRARVALALGLAHQQVGNSNTAKSFIQFAREWGCDRQKIAQVLVAETYKTLGRASALARTEHENTQRAAILSGCPSPLPACGNTDLSSAIGDKVKQPTLATILSGLDKDAAEGIVKQLDQLLAAIIAQERKIDLLGQELKQKIKNSHEQVEALLRIQTYLVSDSLLPSFHGWPVSPDFAYLLIQNIERKRYDLVIEFGSGTSTVLIASVLDRLRKEKHQAYQVAFEHLEKYYIETTESLAGHRTKVHYANLVLAPLVPIQENMQGGKTYKYYDCRSHLKALAEQNSPAFVKLLVVVDGPPGATGPHARYPALPEVLSAFPYAEIDFVLDDTNRKDEQEILIMWKNILDATGHTYSETNYDFEKGAALLEVKPG